MGRPSDTWLLSVHPSALVVGVVEMRRQYQRLRNIIDRCTNPNNPMYPHYGGRGIAVHATWLGRGGFERFVADMGPRPSVRHSIDRIDNDGPYAPENCRWATGIEQGSHTSRTRSITIHGVTLCASEWSRRSGIPEQTLHNRLCRGLSGGALLAPPDAAKSASARRSHKRRAKEAG